MTQVVRALSVESDAFSYVAAAGKFNAAWLKELNLDRGTTHFDAGFDRLIEDFYRDLNFLPAVDISTMVAEEVSLAQVQRLATNYQYLSEVVARVAWLIQEERRGASTPLIRSGDNVVMIRFHNHWHELRVRYLGDSEQVDWGIEVDFFGLLRHGPGDQFLIFSRP